MKLSELVAADPLLDVEVELEAGDIITDLVTVARVARLDHTRDSIRMAVTEHTGAVTQYGIVAAAKLQVEDWMVNGTVEGEF